jgi:DNA-binding transcriptional MerR regulator
MPEVGTAIPKRALFKAAEVCELANVPAYVLKSWEAEFSDLGVSKSPGGVRVYRRGDVERVLKIKRLLYEQGLTLAGARRRLEEEAPSPIDETPIEELLGRNARERLLGVRHGLEEILALLGGQPRARRVESRPVVQKQMPLIPTRSVKSKTKGNARSSHRTKN